MAISTGSSWAVPEIYASVPKLTGKVIEIRSDDLSMTMRIELEEPYDRDRLRDLHSALRRYTNFGFRDYRRPRNREALLIFASERSKGFIVGDRIEILGYAVVGHSDNDRKLGSPYYNKIEKLPPE